MNRAARTFQSLVATLRTSPESYCADLLCHELHMWLAHLPSQHALVAFIYDGNLDRYRWYDGTPVYLKLNGITLTQRPHRNHRGWFIFAEIHRA
jgi:hypothetical protein